MEFKRFERRTKRFSKKISEKVVSFCPRHNPNKFYHASPTGEYSTSTILCNSNEDKPFGLPEEVQSEVRLLFLMHLRHLEERRESVFFTPEQS